MHRRSPRHASATRARATVAAAAVTAVAALVASSACGTDPGEDGDPPERWRPATLADETTVVDGGTAAELALAASETMFERAPVVSVASVPEPDADTVDVPEADALAVEVGAPLLLVPESAQSAAAQPGSTPSESAPSESARPESAPSGQDALTRELARLEPEVVVTHDEAARQWAATVADSEDVSADVVPAGEDLPTVARTEPTDSPLVLALDEVRSAAATTTARAAGARVVTLPEDPDPRSDPDTVEVIASASPGQVVAFGGAFGPPEVLRHRIDVAATGQQLPGGGQRVFPGRRMVALYGHPGSGELGVLGEQPLDEAIARAREVVDTYEDLAEEPVVPTFELITTVASASAGEDGDYSAESSVEDLRPWVEAARDAGFYVVLDLQPGRTDFLTQAQRYEELLVEPHVGLALDPEWRLAPDEVHLEQIGSVETAEVNEVVEWLAGLTREHTLPQKLLVLHQFRKSMVTDRGALETGGDDLVVLVHADGHGTPGQKFATWERLLDQPGPDDLWWGWKNFYDEDDPTFTPEETYDVDPPPVFVSYQ